MASLQQQKRPSFSNWFSSLRRQPKNKKSTFNSGDKHFQRSCIDLSSNSTFYVSSFDVTAGKKPFSLPGLSNGINESATSLATGASTDTLQIDDDRHGLVTKKSVSQLCSRCCCTILSQSSKPNTPESKTRKKTSPIKSPPAVRSPSLAPFTSVATYQIPAISPSSPKSPTMSTLSSKTVMSTEVSRDVKVMRIPNTETDAILYNKRSELKHTTTKTTTRTLIISRPVEVLLNDRGEVISKRAAMTARSNSLGCMLDESIDEDGDESSTQSTRSPVTLDVLSGDENEFRFIDDSSTSQSENERNSLNNKENKFFDNYKEKHKKSSSTNKISQINGNNNNNDLCDVCRNVIKRNAQNSVIMRNKQIKDELCEVVSEMEALDVPEDCKHSNKEKQMSIGRKKFNMDPKKGIEYLVENRLLRHDAQDVAHFLYKGEGLNKTAIGDYLGEKNDFNEDVLKAFVALHDFTNLILVQALRQFLWSFRLPGEAQKIDRMMECFAQRYCQLNPDIFTNTDTCYVLSFAIIMLNTSLHNPSVKEKPDVEQFISMNRGINNGGDLPRGLLESLYESIKTEPFKIPQDDGNDLMHTFFNPDKEGWLWKQGGRYKSWKRRWFILNDNCLYYFEYTTDKEPRGIIPLENISVREIHDRSKPHCFELFATGGADIIKACKTDSEGKVVEGKHTVYRMSAATEEDQQEWIKRLTQSISHNPFYDILVQRKKKAFSKS